MTKVAINLLGWNHKHLLEKCIDSVLAQSFKDFELIYMDNASTDGSVEFVAQRYPHIKIIVNQKNLGYAGGHNLFFSQTPAEFLMVLNPDVTLSPNFLQEAVKGFQNQKVGAVCGKLLRPGSNVIDSTGIVINLARRGGDRGQWEEDRGQYDEKTQIFGVNGAASLYRKTALESVKVPKRDGGFEYFDEDFFAYWEDLDLSWRLNLAGFICVFVPKAVAFHERKAGQARGGYVKLFHFVKHHRQLPTQIKQWNWKNHLFCIVKNDFGTRLLWSLPFIFFRELAMVIYILIFETSTLSVLPQMFSQWPKMLAKRKFIKYHILNSDGRQNLT